MGKKVSVREEVSLSSRGAGSGSFPAPLYIPAFGPEKSDIGKNSGVFFKQNDIFSYSCCGPTSGQKKWYQIVTAVRPAGPA
jgi:hypothetical protein